MSKIVKDAVLEKIKNIMPNHEGVELIYQGSTDGFQSKTFHEKCDDKGPTLTIILANNRVFGGYTNIKWSSTGLWQ